MRTTLVFVALGLAFASSAAAQEQPVAPDTPAVPDPPPAVRVRVVSTPTRASVELLGRGEVGQTPIRRLEVPVGEHDFVFTRAGYARQVVHVAVAEDGQTISAELQRGGRVAVRADHIEARGATIRVDGQSAGVVPATVEVAPGRRLVEVEAEGFLTFGQWVEVQPGRSTTLHVRLEARPPDVGSILVTSDQPGASVEVDGVSRGRTPVHVQGLAPGEHQLVVIANAEEGREPSREERTVEVRAGAREVVAVELLPAPEPTGTFLVLTQPAGATVVLDGQTRGVTPVSLQGLSPGEHRIELSLDGHDPAERIATVIAGEEVEVSVALQPGTPRPGRIMVSANREDAFVIVDGLSRGRAPITLEQVSPGSHAVRLQAEGAAVFETECVIRFGETCTVAAELVPRPIPVQVLVRHGGQLVPGAVLSIDAEPRELPFEGELELGPHRFEVRADGFEPFREERELVAGMDPLRLEVELAPLAPPEPAPGEAIGAPQEPPPAEDEAPAFLARDGAAPLPFESGAVTVFAGWPFLGGAEVDVGLPGPFDIGLAARTFGRVTELELHGRLGAALAEVVALGLWVRLATDFGPDQINGFLARLDGRIALRPSPEVVVSLWGGVDLSTDDYPYDERDASAPLTPVGMVPRQNLARARIGGGAGWGFAASWSLNLRFEGILASTGGRRRMLGDVVGLGNQDSEVYAELGVGYRF